jgi:SAM-dependent methyltransferase
LSGALEFDAAMARGVEAIYRTPDVAGQRSLTLAAMALCPGERVLDVGVGPGLLAYEMALVVGEAGRVAGIDASEPMIEMARQRCREQSWTDLRIADATAVPFGDASFDAVVSTQVYEYVDNLPEALAEVARVLRPGGRVFILDTDWDTAIWHTGDRARMRRVLDAWEGHLHDPCLPRTLGPKLEAAGLRVVRRDVIPLSNPALHPNCYSHGMLAAIAGYVAGEGGVGQDEADAWLAEQRSLGARGEYFFSINRYLFGAIRA